MASSAPANGGRSCPSARGEGPPGRAGAARDGSQTLKRPLHFALPNRICKIRRRVFRHRWRGPVGAGGLGIVCIGGVFRVRDQRSGTRAGVESDLVLGDTESRGAAGKRLLHQLRTITGGKAPGKANPSRRHGHASTAHDGVRRARALGGAIAHRVARHRPRGSAISGRVCAGRSGVTLRIRSRAPAVICERLRFLFASRLGRANQNCKTDEREPVRSRMSCGCLHGDSSNRLAGQRVPRAIDGFLGDNLGLIDRFGFFSIRWPSLDVLRPATYLGGTPR